jgi:hypothetical protein
MPRLDYATQVSELEKIAKLSNTPAVVRKTPELRAPDQSAQCLVCGARPARACAECGSVAYCGVDHQRSDARFHDVVCDALRDIAEDERSVEDDLTTELLACAGSDIRTLVGWDTLFGADAPPTRRRKLSDLATRPLTLANALAALGVQPKSPGVLSIHVMAATHRELAVPAEVWALAGQLLSPRVRLELAFVGPELPDGPGRTRRALYSRALWPELGQPDLVIGYDCGLLMYPSWKSTILDLRGRGVPFVITSYREWEAAAEARLLSAVSATCLLAPVANPWASLAGKRSSTIANDLSFDNAYVSAWR